MPRRGIQDTHTPISGKKHTLRGDGEAKLFFVLFGGGGGGGQTVDPLVPWIRFPERKNYYRGREGCG